MTTTTRPFIVRVRFVKADTDARFVDVKKIRFARLYVIVTHTDGEIVNYRNEDITEIQCFRETVPM